VKVPTLSCGRAGVARTKVKQRQRIAILPRAPSLERGTWLPILGRTIRGPLPPHSM